MDQLIQVLIIGLANGLIFALVALGYTLVYGIIELINFAHGDVFMLGSMLAYFLIAPAVGRRAGASSRSTPTPRCPLLIAQVLAVLAICMVAMATLNVVIERIAYRPLRNAPKLAPLISAIGVSYVLQNVGLVLGGAYQRTIDSVFPTTNLLEPFGITTIVVTASQVFVGRRHDPAADRPVAVRVPDPPGQGDARDGAGPRHRGPDGRRRQPHDRDHLPDRRRPGRRGRCRPAAVQRLHRLHPRASASA